MNISHSKMIFIKLHSSYCIIILNMYKCFGSPSLKLTFKGWKLYILSESIKTYICQIFLPHYILLQFGNNKKKGQFFRNTLFKLKTEEKKSMMISHLKMLFIKPFSTYYIILINIYIFLIPIFSNHLLRVDNFIAFYYGKKQYLSNIINF